MSMASIQFHDRSSKIWCCTIGWLHVRDLKIVLRTKIMRSKYVDEAKCAKRKQLYNVILCQAFLAATRPKQRNDRRGLRHFTAATRPKQCLWVQQAKDWLIHAAWIVDYLGLQVKTLLMTCSGGWATAIVRENANGPTRKPQSLVVDHN